MGVTPCASGLFGLAPWASSNLTASRRPWWIARINAVCPLASNAFTSTFVSSTVLSSAKSPLPAARKKSSGGGIGAPEAVVAAGVGGSLATGAGVGAGAGGTCTAEACRMSVGAGALAGGAELVTVGAGDGGGEAGRAAVSARAPDCGTLGATAAAEGIEALCGTGALWRATRAGAGGAPADVCELLVLAELDPTELDPTAADVAAAVCD